MARVPKMLTLLAATVIATAVLGGCSSEDELPPMDFQPGRWESEDGQWWITISDSPAIMEMYLPPREESPVGVCTLVDSNPVRASRELDFSLDDIGQIGYEGPGRHPVLYLRDVDDWRVIIDHPCGLEADPLEFVYQGGS